MIEGFKSMFDDLTPGLLERVAGNIYLLDVDDQGEEDLMLSWFLIHYKAERKLNISVSRLFDEDDEDGKRRVHLLGANIRSVYEKTGKANKMTHEEAVKRAAGAGELLNGKRGRDAHATKDGIK